MGSHLSQEEQRDLGTRRDRFIALQGQEATLSLTQWLKTMPHWRRVECLCLPFNIVLLEPGSWPGKDKKEGFSAALEAAITRTPYAWSSHSAFQRVSHMTRVNTSINTFYLHHLTWRQDWCYPNLQMETEDPEVPHQNALCDQQHLGTCEKLHSQALLRPAESDMHFNKILATVRSTWLSDYPRPECSPRFFFFNPVMLQFGWSSPQLVAKAHIF
jgi:hypothetical protein